MNTLIALGAVAGASTAAFMGGVIYTTARCTTAMVALGWRPPATQLPPNPWRGNGGAR